MNKIEKKLCAALDQLATKKTVVAVLFSRERIPEQIDVMTVDPVTGFGGFYRIATEPQGAFEFLVKHYRPGDEKALSEYRDLIDGDSWMIHADGRTDKLQNVLSAA